MRSRPVPLGYGRDHNRMMRGSCCADQAPAGGSASAGSRHALMHRTETIDYGIVLEGEITLILDVGEAVVRAGDIVIQRGTNHGWANRSGKNCRIAFILIDGKYEDGL